MERGKTIFYFGICAVIVGAAATAIFSAGYWQLSVMIGAVGLLMTFFSLFEYKQVAAEKTVIIAVLAALASAGRIIFSIVPSFQPASFIILSTGVVFGGEAGFLVGAMTALLSNMALGQGPWTIWQMAAWGLMGLSAAWLRRIFVKNIFAMAVFGFLWGFIYGLILNIWTVLLLSRSQEINLAYVVVIYAQSLFFDFLHAMANFMFTILLGGKIIKILNRSAVKYGL